MTVQLLCALAAGYGTFLLYTGSALGWRGLGMGPRLTGGTRRRWRPARADSVAFVTWFGSGFFGAWALFGSLLPALAVGAFVATTPAARARRRRDRAAAAAREAWPRLVEDMRSRIGSLGRSVPQALFEAGGGAPAEVRAAFADAERHWLVTTDFSRTVALLEDRLADATADAVLETLLVAHEVGGGGIDARLAALVEDRTDDARGRREAAAKQAGVRFARRFVLLVPLGMAVAGLSIGNGRAAYGTGTGQVAVASGVGMVAACWMWAGRLLRLPDEERVL